MSQSNSDNRRDASFVYLFNDIDDAAEVKSAQKATESDQVPRASLDYEVYTNDASDDHRMMECALWGTGLSVWSWSRDESTLEVKAFENGQYRQQRVFDSFEKLCEIVHPQDVNELRHKWYEILSEYLISFQHQFRMLVGLEYSWIQLKGRVTSSDDEGAKEIVGTFLDITDQKNNEIQSTLMSYAFAKTTQAMLITQKNLHVVDANAAFYAEIDPQFSLVNNDSFVSKVKITKSQMASLQSHGTLNIETEYALNDTCSMPVSLSFSLFHVLEQNEYFYIIALTNLTQRRAAEAKLHQLANYDPLTGLLNRRALKQHLDELIETQESSFSLCYMDFDGFKKINDAFGHEFGDALLEKLGHAFSSEINEALSIARWGGDEIIFVFNSIDERALTRIFQRIFDIVSAQNIVVNGQRFPLKAQIGVSVFPTHGTDTSQLIQHADAALFHVKADADCKWCMYSQGMADDKLKQISFVNDVRDALENEELHFVLQGKFNQERALIGAELLCRWQSKKHGFVSPALFISVIEKHGMEYQLGELALRNAMQFVSSVNASRINVPISVNVSSSQFLQASFVELLTRLLREYKVDPAFIELEITESVFMVDEHAAMQNFEQVHALGLRISLDDFGTGFSSLSYLSKYHFDVVKIDRQFIINLAEDKKAHRLFVAMLNMCQALDMDTVVEGIETEQQFQMLSDSGVTKFQGFLLGKPIAIGDFLTAYYCA